MHEYIKTDINERLCHNFGVRDEKVGEQKGRQKLVLVCQREPPSHL